MPFSTSERMHKYNRTPKGKYNKYKQQAKYRGIYFDITLEEFIELIESPCSYCGVKTKIGVDRVDNDLPYILENCAPCCFICNMMKKNLDADAFIEHCKSIAKYQN